MNDLETLRSMTLLQHYRLQRERYSPALAYTIARMRFLWRTLYCLPPNFHLHTHFRGRRL